IFVTAIHGSEKQVSVGYAVGAVDYMFKPIVPEILKSKVSVFVELFGKTEAIKQQAQRLAQAEKREHERVLQDERRRWADERLAAERARERETAAALAHKAEELARNV